MKQVIYFGAGQVCHEVESQIVSLAENKKVFCMGLMDNNSELWGKKMLGTYISKPQKIDHCDYYVILSPKYFQEIKEQLINTYRVDEKKIVLGNTFLRNEYAKCQYDKRPRCEGKAIFDTEKITIYSCIMGDYDELKDPQYISHNINYVCFTNNPKVKSDVWKVVLLKTKFQLNNIYMARYIKLFPDLFLENSGTSVWVDAKYEIKDDLRKYIKKYQGKEKILCFPHPERDCVYQEGEACIHCKKVDEKSMHKQIRSYQKQGYPTHNGLYETGCIVRVHGDKNVQRLMQEWWHEIQRHTYRDQVSFPFVCEKMKITPDICDLDINNNQWLQVCQHK